MPCVYSVGRILVCVRVFAQTQQQHTLLAFSCFGLMVWWLGYEGSAVPMWLDSSCVAHLRERFKLLYLIAQHSADLASGEGVAGTSKKYYIRERTREFARHIELGQAFTSYQKFVACCLRPLYCQIILCGTCINQCNIACAYLPASNFRITSDKSTDTKPESITNISLTCSHGHQHDGDGDDDTLPPPRWC